MYGYQITQEAKKLTEGDLEMTEGALYPILHKLEGNELIVSESQIINGRTRKYYLLTKKGKEVQQVQEEEMKVYLHHLSTIFK